MRKIQTVLKVGVIALVASSLGASGKQQPDSPRNQTPPATHASAQGELQALALTDLTLLSRQLTFRPFLPPGLSLPAKYRYNRVVWGPAPVNGFGIFISSDDPNRGNRAIHLDEALLSASDLANPRDPMNAFSAALRPITLANGPWFEMRQQHQPWKGSLILLSLRGRIAIEVDGLDSTADLESFAGALRQ